MHIPIPGKTRSLLKVRILINNPIKEDNLSLWKSTWRTASLGGIGSEGAGSLQH